MQPYDTLLQMFARIYRCISTAGFFCLYRPIPATHRPEIKAVFLDIKDNYFRRYLYLFLKFLHFEGYVVYLPPHPKLMYALRNDVYASYLLEEKIVHFARPQAKAGILHIHKHLISADYFSGLLNDEHCASFYVPMSQDPSMYHLGYWNTPLENRVRKKSVFMAGNFACAEYYTIEKDRIFALLSNDLKTRLSYLQGLSSDTIARMRENVLHYYDNYLTPHGVVARIESRDYKNIYLQAEHYSVQLLKNRRHQIGAESA